MLVDKDFVEKFMEASLQQRSDMIIEYMEKLGVEIGTIEYGSFSADKFYPLATHRATVEMW